ncbi:S-adenosyl-L-methionine-dependent methyltransferase [Powellomyces hirtus]|nr:S-adenosyl-L-methionine-dependent methyltransferase [Powellomyces hirtus]
MESVQFPSAEVRNLVNIYTELRPESTSQSRHRPTILREDFCGTGILCREWCKGGVEREAWGVDLDPTVIKYAKERTLGLDGGPECERVKVVLGNVLDDRKTLGVPRADIIAALNYGVNFFKKRADLMAYLKNSRENLAEGGTLIVDLFGGATVNGTGGRLFERRYDGFTYFFEQKPFDLMTNTSRVHLHFRFDDGSWMKNAYTYDFRAYSIVEIREAMLEAGFASTHVWIAASTDEKEAEGYVNDDDDEEDAEEDDEESEQQDDSEDGSEEDERPTARRRKQVTSGSPNEGAYAYSRVVGSLNQLQSYNAYVIGII